MENTQVPDKAGAARLLGARARIGLIVPTTNTVNEAEWQLLSLPGVSYHTARMPLHGASDPDEALPVPLKEALDRLTPAPLTSLAYGCTAGSMVTPPEKLPDAMTAATGLPCTSTAEAIVRGLQALGARRVAVASPYHDALNAQWQQFLEQCGFEISAIRGLGIGAGGPAEFGRISQLPPGEIEAHAMAAFQAAPADALLLSCTDMPTLPLLSKLESTLGVPVLSSNTATLWRALRLAGIDDTLHEGGALLTTEGL